MLAFRSTTSHLWAFSTSRPKVRKLLNSAQILFKFRFSSTHTKFILPTSFTRFSFLRLRISFFTHLNTIFYGFLANSARFSLFLSSFPRISSGFTVNFTNSTLPNNFHQTAKSKKSSSSVNFQKPISPFQIHRKKDQFILPNQPKNGEAKTETFGRFILTNKIKMIPQKPHGESEC